VFEPIEFYSQTLVLNDIKISDPLDKHQSPQSHSYQATLDMSTGFLYFNQIDLK